MAESSRHGSQARRRVPSGLVGMVVLVVLVECLIRCVEPGINGILPADWRRTGRLASGSAEVRSASILCFGDSLVKLGVQPRLIEKSLGESHRGYNLALSSGRAPASYFLLRRALQSGAKPEAIVVDFNDSFLAEPPAVVLRLYAELLESREIFEMTRTMNRPGLTLTWFALQSLPSVRNRFEVRRAILDGLAAALDNKRAVLAGSQRNWERNLGAQVMPKIAIPLAADPAAWGWVQPLGWRPEPTNAAYLGRFFALAEAHNIPVFWLLPPLHPGFSARRDELGLNAPFDAFIAEILGRFPHVVVVDGRRAKYDASVFIDMAHLDLDGSRRLSEALASVVGEALAHAKTGPRVVALPSTIASSPRIAAEGAPLPR